MKIESVAIEITANAFLPEAYAYRNFFVKNGYRCELVRKGSPDVLSYDAVLLFHGFHPFWRKYPKFVIGEYHSLSVGRFSRLKDFLKRIVNVRADFYIFLNDSVRKTLYFSNRVPFALRGMGFDKEKLGPRNDSSLEFDVVYCGSFREGVECCIDRLASLGFKVAVVGFDSSSAYENVSSFGRVSPSEAMEIIHRSRWGLNYTPDVHPLNIQDSTKVIEYSGAGLGVITNRYAWLDQFEQTRGGRFLDITTVKDKRDVTNFEFEIPNVDDLEWSVVMSQSLGDLLDRMAASDPMSDE